MSLYSLPCLQEVAGITVLWGVRGAAGLFPCEGMTWPTKSEPRDVAHTSFIEILGGARMHGIRTGAEPIARWNPDGYPGGSHLQCI